MSRKRKSDEIEQGFQQGLANVTGNKTDPEAQIFIRAGVDPTAPIDPEIDREIIKMYEKKARASDALNNILLDAKDNFREATGKSPDSGAQIGGGKRRRTRRRSKKSKKRKTKRRKYRK
jgi:hypothetical protein